MAIDVILMMKAYIWTLIPWFLPKSDKLLLAVEPQKQNLAASRTKGDASIVENKATWHVYAQRRNISIQSCTKLSKSLSITNQDTPIVWNILNRSSIDQGMINWSLIIIEDSENRISNCLNSAIIRQEWRIPRELQTTLSGSPYCLTFWWLERRMASRIG